MQALFCVLANLESTILYKSMSVCWSCRKWCEAGNCEFCNRPSSYVGFLRLPKFKDVKTWMLYKRLYFDGDQIPVGSNLGHEKSFFARAVKNSLIRGDSAELDRLWRLGVINKKTIASRQKLKSKKDVEQYCKSFSFDRSFRHPSIR